MHWAKNLFVFVGLIFSHKITDWTSVYETVLIFLAFSLAAGAVYVWNDICDREEDRLHPVKRLRPIARGSVAIPVALKWSLALTACSLALAVVVSWLSAVIIAAYLLVNLGYSLFLKKIVILDVMIIGIGFVLRVLGGTILLGYEITGWILICTFFLAVFIGFSKRRYEIIMDGSAVLPVKGYSPYMLDMLMILSASSILSAYTLYIMFRQEWQNGLSIYFSVLPVFFGVLRYVYLIHQSRTVQDHTKLILTDRLLMGAVAVWILLWMIELYYINPRLTLTEQ